MPFDKDGDGPKDESLALENYIHAAELGHAEARNKVWIMYRDGHGVEQSYSKAFEWLYKNAIEGVPGSQTALCDMWYDGQGVEKNYYNAKDWYRKAVIQGRDRGQYMLGYMYYYGQGVNKNMALAREWMGKAVQQDMQKQKNSNRTSILLGQSVAPFYRKGQCTPQTVCQR